MSVAIVSQDIDQHPDNLLPIAKTHARVDGSYDDVFIKSVIARAIARFEQVNRCTVNPTEVLWKPKTTEFCNGFATVPVRPVNSFSVMVGDPPTQSFDYSIDLKWDDIYGIPILAMTGPAVAGLAATLTCGFDDLPPPVLDVVLRHTSHLYNHREILLPDREYVAPDLDATWWMPAV